MVSVPDIDTLAKIFSNAIAPAFFLVLVAAFVSLMMSRLAAVNERIRATRALPDQDSATAASSMALGPLTRRARLLNDGIILSLGSGICATLLLAILFGISSSVSDHAYGAGYSLCCRHFAPGGLRWFGSARKHGMHAANWRNSD